MSAGKSRRQPLPERVEEAIQQGVAVVVPQQAWRSLLLGFGAGAMESLVQRAMAERMGREEESVGS